MASAFFAVVFPAANLDTTHDALSHYGTSRPLKLNSARHNLHVRHNLNKRLVCVLLLSLVFAYATSVCPAQQPRKNSIYCEAQCNNVTSGLNTGIRALALSIANDNATILRPECCGKQNQHFAFYDLTTTKKCQAELKKYRRLFPVSEILHPNPTLPDPIPPN